MDALTDGAVARDAPPKCSPRMPDNPRDGVDLLLEVIGRERRQIACWCWCNIGIVQIAGRTD